MLVTFISAILAAAASNLLLKRWPNASNGTFAALSSIVIFLIAVVALSAVFEVTLGLPRSWVPTEASAGAGAVVAAAWYCGLRLKPESPDKR